MLISVIRTAVAGGVMSVEAQAVLASGEPPISFRAHEIRAANPGGARDDFEQMVGMLISATYPGARMIYANPGDWGIDVLVGNLGGSVVIWQAKYFMPAVTESHQSEIRKSFTSALKAAEEHGHQVRQWTLCVPSSLDAKTDKWWTGWKSRQQNATGVKIELWHEVELRRMLISPDAADVRRHYYDPYHPAPPLEHERAPVHQVAADTATELETALFVRQLREAGHPQVAAAKLQFFNAELLAREIADKAVPGEVAALIEADATVYGIWESRFNEIYEKDPSGPTLPGLHAAVMSDIRQMTDSWPKPLRAGPVHGCGFMHRVVDDSRAGWVVHWEDVAARHRGSVAGSGVEPSGSAAVQLVPEPAAGDAAQATEGGQP